LARLRAEDAERRRTSGQSKDFLEVLRRSIEVITAMGSDQQALTLSDISRLTTLPRPSVRRILHTLATLGYVEIIGRTFRLTPKIVGLATSYLGAGGASRVLQHTCDELSSRTGQSSLVGVLDDKDVLVVAYSMPRELMAPYLGVGARFDAFSSAAGRILLSGLPEESLDEFVASISDDKIAEAGLSGREAVKNDVEKVRKDGFAILDETHERGWFTISYPILRHDGSNFGVLSLNCNKNGQQDGEYFSNFNGICRETAARLSNLVTW
jgi:IclR family pca regulon transcriptional regulator